MILRQRKRFLFTGIVQGVGFRPFIFRLATEQRLAGFVQNRPDGVVVEVEGLPAAVESFLARVKHDQPPLAHIEIITETEQAPIGEGSFRIIPSESGGRLNVHISPDMAVCEDCLAELFDPVDRRFRYPFINCTNCGPRLTIIKDIPYDRVNTSMACFPLCIDCRREYEDPANRRFHAEPNACPVCGPALALYDSEGKPVATDDPLEASDAILKAGHILAIKGIGGFHLSVDASLDKALKRLRSRKYREEKPLAIMVKDIPGARTLAVLSAAEENLLQSPERPIVLVKRRPDSPVSPLVAPGMSTLGIMLPYTPLQHLLLEKGFTALVMTSANQTDEPICIGNREALARLTGIADYFLVHNRDILMRCDDSVAMVAGAPRMLRRARGFAPRPFLLKESYPQVLALGPQLKATICILKANTAFMSPHIGDMETPQARDFFHENIALMQRITECFPEIVACDLHPGYYSTRVAESLQGVRLVKVQHHHAHIVSCIAENGIRGEVIGVAMDGTGYGTDGHVWGSEFLLADVSGFRRVGRLREFLLPGGEKAIREPWRIALSLLKETFGSAWQGYAEQLALIPAGVSRELLEKVLEQRIVCPRASSLGRLFDGVAALLKIRHKVNFEGQAAMELEALATSINMPEIPFFMSWEKGMRILDWTPFMRYLVEAALSGEDRGGLAYAFHKALIRAFTEMVKDIREEAGLQRVALSGGCFQNRILLEGCIAEMEQAGFQVYHHRFIPTNDGGIALGQAVCAGAQALSGKIHGAETGEMAL